jgi:multidrug transporter EmrE-like cation transporter
MAQKSKMYYRTRSVVRGVFRFLVLLAAYIILHLAAYNIWTALLFIGVVACGFVIYDNKTPHLATAVK